MVEDLSGLIDREGIDEVIIALPNASSADMLQLISQCDRSSISIKVLPDLFQIMAGQMSVSDLGGLPLLTMRDVALRGWKLTLKRGVDLFGSAIGLVILSPLMLLHRHSDQAGFAGAGVLCRRSAWGWTASVSM